MLKATKSQINDHQQVNLPAKPSLDELPWVQPNGSPIRFPPHWYQCHWAGYELTDSGKPDYTIPLLGPPVAGQVVPFYPFLGEGFPTTIDYRKKGTLILASLLEDLGYVQFVKYTG